MCELVDALTISGREVASIADTKSLKKKLPHGASLDIWKVKDEEEASVAI
jgi:hypothetical protein